MRRFFYEAPAEIMRNYTTLEAIDELNITKAPTGTYFKIHRKESLNKRRFFCQTMYSNTADFI
jgi:hypothetical protein